MIETLLVIFNTTNQLVFEKKCARELVEFYTEMSNIQQQQPKNNDRWTEHTSSLHKMTQTQICDKQNKSWAAFELDDKRERDKQSSCLHRPRINSHTSKTKQLQ